MVGSARGRYRLCKYYQRTIGCHICDRRFNGELYRFDKPTAATYATVATTGSYTDLINTPWTISGTTINYTGSQQLTGSLTLAGGTVLSPPTVSGNISISGNRLGSYDGIQFPNGTLRCGSTTGGNFGFHDGTTWLFKVDTFKCLWVYGGAVILGDSEVSGLLKCTNLTVVGDLYPTNANTGYVGVSAAPFNRGYMQNGVITTSDGNLKSSVELPYGLNEIMQIKPIAYKWKTQSDLAETDPEKHHIYYGVDARQIHDSNILPELCYTGDTLTVNYSELTPVLINAVKEQQKQIEELQTALRSINSNVAFTPIQKNISENLLERITSAGL